MAGYLTRRLTNHGAGSNSHVESPFAPRRAAVAPVERRCPPSPFDARPGCLRRRRQMMGGRIIRQNSFILFIGFGYREISRKMVHSAKIIHSIAGYL